MYNKSQIFSTDLVVAVIVFTFILITSAWFWDATKEKMHLSESRNDLELITHNAVSVLINTVGDPPNWHRIEFNDSSVYSLGIGKNRPWFLDVNKASRLGELNSTDYELIKRMLGIRGANYEFFLNISKFNKTSEDFEIVSLVGKFPNSSSSNVISISRTMLSDIDDSWVSFNMLVWNLCEGVKC